jgi:integrase
VQPKWAGLMGLNYPHGIRHACLTMLVNAGVSEDVVNRIAGHQSFRSMPFRSMLGRYSKRRDIAVLRAAIEHLKYD